MEGPRRVHPPWYATSDVSRRLASPFPEPGGPPAVAGAAASKRQRVSDFQQQAAAALGELAAQVEQGLSEQQQQQQLQQVLGAGPLLEQQPLLQEQQQQGGQEQQLLLLQQQEEQQEQQEVRQEEDVRHEQQHQQQQHDAAEETLLDCSDLRLPLVPPGSTGAGLLPLLAAGAQQGGGLGLPPACAQLDCWRDAAGTTAVPAAARGVKAAGSRAPAAAAAADGDGDGDDALQPGGEVVVTLSVLEVPGSENRDRTVMQVIQALGSNTLAEVRDAIRCPLDALAAGLGAGNPAAYFFMEGAFYDDTRSAPAAECSELLRRWAAAAGLAVPRALDPALLEDASDWRQQHQQQQQQRQQEQQQQQQQQEQEPWPASELTMQETRVADLSLRVSNRPMCLYSHQGCCEHPVMVADVRLLHEADPARRRGQYPRTLHRAPLARRFVCSVCGGNGALALLLNHPETPECVAMLCGRCEPLFDVSAAPACRKVMLDGSEPAAR